MRETTVHTVKECTPDKYQVMSDIPNPDPLFSIYDLWRRGWEKKKEEVKNDK